MYAFDSSVREVNEVLDVINKSETQDSLLAQYYTHDIKTKATFKSNAPEINS